MTPQWPQATLFTVHVTQPPVKHLHLSKLHVAHEVCLAYVSVKAHANIEKKNISEKLQVFIYSMSIFGHALKMETVLEEK